MTQRLQLLFASNHVVNYQGWNFFIRNLQAVVFQNGIGMMELRTPTVLAIGIQARIPVDFVSYRFYVATPCTENRPFHILGKCFTGRSRLQCVRGSSGRAKNLKHNDFAAHRSRAVALAAQMGFATTIVC